MRKNAHLHQVVFIGILLLGILPVSSFQRAELDDTSYIADKKQFQTPTEPSHPLLNLGPKAVASGKRVMVSTQLASVTEAALEVLNNGGNAVDAFITAVFLQHVQDYHQVSLFGAMGGIFFEAATGKYHVFDAYSERPQLDNCGLRNPSKVAIAGTVRGLEALAKRFGTKSWASYLKPAITAAENGVVVTSYMYGINYTKWKSSSLIQRNRAAWEFYMPDGHLVPVGQLWKMPALAKTLKSVSLEGADYMYTGAWGRKFVGEATSRGFCVTNEDMAAYQVRWPEPLKTTYRNFEIISEPPPKKGGVQIAYNLNILENFELHHIGHYAESGETLEIMARTFGRVEDDTRWAITDPLNFRIPTSLFLSKDYARMGAEFVRDTMVLPGIDLAPAMRWISGENSTLDTHANSSNHLVIVDAEGNWITSLHTAHGGAPGIFIDGVEATGSDFPGCTTGPGRRVSANSTGIIVARDGQPWLSLGSPGVPPQPVTQVLVSIIDFGMDPKSAVDAPRFHAFRSAERVVDIESRIDDSVLQKLRSRGIDIRNIGPYNNSMGSMQIIWRDPKTGILYGVSDPRRLGHAAGY